jgi:flagellum-specific ATP synthase
MVDMGLYKAGANAELDEALARMPALEAFLRQGLFERDHPQHAFSAMAKCLEGPVQT